MHNKSLGRYATNKAEELEGIAHGHHGSQKSKADYVKALNTYLFYDLVI